ncbi:hypothetical protein M885DRAFT_519490 [Pelagophyceae sp. CCMP2097]|nr:hypothetical protein M885DRAFT_519490 [Pelagophyceae sp. CCMP2097]
MPAALGSVERYYEVIALDGGVEVNVAPNGIGVLRLAASHPALRADSITAITYDAALHTDFSGKRKKGAMYLKPNTPLATVTFDGIEAKITCGLKAQLLAKNDALEAAPESVKQPRGFLAIVTPHDVEALRKRRRGADVAAAAAANPAAGAPAAAAAAAPVLAAPGVVAAAASPAPVTADAPTTA